ncbi:MAG: hypothetical protein IOC82_15095 [Aestuariivirga sp.]|uniref:hypothetical protein n=1 Tax=Aestuariivirga sp. TaxID=2650926 RepID=UPI0025B9658D|nr:hypothetical protein [Aestuariivirga sp.]MCA3562349.1 hypothetical protein [Aestuariivirga sp.]
MSSTHPLRFVRTPGTTFDNYLLRQVHIDWLLARGVSPEAIIKPTQLCLARGNRGADGVFEPDTQGPEWLLFAEQSDAVLWRPRTGEIATEWGVAFALGAEEIVNPGVTAFGGWLHIHASPLDWLRADRRGIVVLRWEWAFEQLRHVERIAVAESILGTYRKHMRPRLPEIAVLPSQSNWRAAA